MKNTKLSLKIHVSEQTHKYIRTLRRLVWSIFFVSGRNHLTKARSAPRHTWTCIGRGGRRGRCKLSTKDACFLSCRTGSCSGIKRLTVSRLQWVLGCFLCHIVVVIVGTISFFLSFFFVNYHHTIQTRDTDLPVWDSAPLKGRCPGCTYPQRGMDPGHCP